MKKEEIFIQLKEIKPEEEYNKLLASGMFYEFHPELTGEYKKDKKQWLSFLKKRPYVQKIFRMDLLQILQTKL